MILSIILNFIVKTFRLEAAEEILYQWLNLIKNEKLNELKNNQSTQKERDNIRNIINQIDFIVPTIEKRVYKNRIKKNLVESSSNKEDSFEEYKEGDILQIDDLHHLKEKHAFENNIKFSKLQANINYNRENDKNFQWEQNLDEKNNFCEEILYKNSLPHIIELSKLFEDFENIDSGNEVQDPSRTILYPSDVALMMMVKMWSDRGSWASCLSVCNSMLIRQKNVLHGDENQVEELSSNKLFSTGKIAEAFELYNKNVKSSLSVCYRHTLRTLCNNNQYNIALLLTNQIREKNIIITPSSLALILSMFKINENFKADFDNEKVNLLDFQDEIIDTILIAIKFEKMNYLYSYSKERSQTLLEIENRNESETAEEIALGEECSSDCREGYLSSNQRNEIEIDQSSSSALISVNVKLLCERGNYYIF